MGENKRDWILSIINAVISALLATLGVTVTK